MESHRQWNALVQLRHLAKQSAARGAIDVFGDEEQLAVLLPEIQDPDDVRVVELAAESSFSAEHRHERRGPRILREDPLRSDALPGVVGSGAARRVNESHAAATDHLFDPVRTLAQRGAKVLANGDGSRGRSEGRR